MDFSNEMRSLKVKIDVTPEQIMQQLNIDGAYLVLEGLVATPKIIAKIIKDGSIFYACRIQDKG